VASTVEVTRTPQNQFAVNGVRSEFYGQFSGAKKTTVLSPKIPHRKTNHDVHPLSSSLKTRLRASICGEDPQIPLPEAADCKRGAFV
jgi:hypothetical protein